MKQFNTYAQYQINDNAVAREIKLPHGSIEIGVYIDEAMVGVITHPVNNTWWFWRSVKDGEKLRFRSKRGALERAEKVSRTFVNLDSTSRIEV